MQLEEYPPLSLQKRKSPAPIAELSTFHFPSAEKFSLHLAFGKRRTVVRLCKAQPFQILHFALKRLTDTQVACRLDWQGLIVFNILHFPCTVKKNTCYLPQIPGQARNDAGLEKIPFVMQIKPSRDWRSGEAVATGNGAGQGPAEPRKARNKRPPCRLLLMFATFALTNDAPSVALLVHKKNRGRAV